MRLNKYLSENGVCSRREADRLIEAGKVSVDGVTAVLGQILTGAERVEVSGRLVETGAREVYYAVNKPRGVVVTTDRTWGDPVLEDLVPDSVRVFAVGRLDKDSEGLILMTNNGDVSNQIQKARERHEKEYLVTVDRPVTDTFLREMREGVYLEELDRTTRPCRVKKTGKNQFDIVLTEGMNRQIRRMCHALGFEVTTLQRIRVMNILLGDLAPGKYRDLSDEEVRGLKSQLKPVQRRSQKSQLKPVQRRSQKA